MYFYSIFVVSSKAFELVERAKENPLIAKKNYEDAAELFKKYKSFYLEAAKCLYSCEKYEEAKEKFIQTKSWVEAADTILKIIKTDPEKATLNKRIKDLYIEAVKYFDNAAKYAKALELCDICEEYQLMVILIIKYERYLNDFPNWFESKLRIYVVDIEKKILAICK